MRTVGWKRVMLAFTVAGGVLAGRARDARAQQDSTTPSVDERLKDLDQQIRILKRQRELERDSLEAAAKDRPKVSAGKDGFWLRSADGAFTLHVGGYIQADSRTFLDDNAVALNNAFLLRRIRPLFEGTVFKYFDFRILPDWGGGTAVIQDAYVVGRVSKEFQVKAGKFKGPVGLERLQSALDIAFVERAFPTALVPNRDLGFALTGDIGGAILHYDVGIFDGTIDGGSVDTDIGDNKDGEGRLYVTPFAGSGVEFVEGLSVGVGGAVGEEHGTPTASALTTYKTPGQNTFFSYRNDATAAGSAVANGRRWRVSPQAYWHYGPVGLLGEWVEVVAGGDPRCHDGDDRGQGLAGARDVRANGRGGQLHRLEAEQARGPEGRVRRDRAGGALQRAQGGRRGVPDVRRPGEVSAESQGMGGRTQLVPRAPDQDRGQLRADELRGRRRRGRRSRGREGAADSVPGGVLSGALQRLSTFADGESHHGTVTQEDAQRARDESGGQPLLAASGPHRRRRIPSRVSTALGRLVRRSERKGQADPRAGRAGEPARAAGPRATGACGASVGLRGVVRADARPRPSRCSTSPTTRRASCTRT